MFSGMFESILVVFGCFFVATICTYTIRGADGFPFADYILLLDYILRIFHDDPNIMGTIGNIHSTEQTN